MAIGSARRFSSPIHAGGGEAIAQARKAWWYATPIMMVIAIVTVTSPFVTAAEDVEAEGSVFKQTVLLASFAIALVVVLKESEGMAFLVRANLPLILLLGYAFLTCNLAPPSVWTYSLKRWFQFLALVLYLFAVMCAPRGPQRALAILRMFSGATMVLSFVLTCLEPAAHMKDGSWCGVFSTRNHFGTACVLSLAVWLPTLTPVRSLRAFAGSTAMVGLIGFLLAASRSATATVTGLMIVGVFVAMRLPFRTAVKCILAVLLICVILVTLYAVVPESPLDVAFKAIGRDKTFTGRIYLWEWILDEITYHPVFGYGYNAFYVGSAGKAEEVARKLFWTVNQAHNGYLDILNEMGIVGLALFAIVFVQAVRRTYAWPDPSFFFIVIGTALENCFESTYCRIISLLWIAFLTALIATGPQPAARRVRHAAFEPAAATGFSGGRGPR